MAWNEGSLKKKINKDLDNIGAWHFAYVPVGYGASGIPDIIACKSMTIKPEDVGKTLGLFVGIEAKLKGNKPTKLQQAQLEGIAAAGGTALVITGEKGKPYEIRRIEK